MISLDELKTIKPRQIKLLQENGITSVAALAMSNPNEVAEIDGMSEKASKTLVWGARHELGMGEFRSVSEMEINTKYITTGSDSFDVPLFALPFKATHDIRPADLSPQGRQEWLGDFVDLQRRLFPKSTQVTPNILPFFDECVEFIQEFGPDNLIVFTHDQGRRIGLGWGTPNCFDMNEETRVCKSILLFGGAIEPEYQRKGVLKQMIGLFATWNAQNGITHGEMPIGEDNAASIHMAKAYGGKQNRSHVIMQIEL